MDEGLAFQAGAHGLLQEGKPLEIWAPSMHDAGGPGRDLSCVCGKAAANGRKGKDEDHKSKK